MAKRTSLRTMRNLAHRICQLVATFTPILNIVYANNGALLAAIQAANAACGTLVERADEALESGA